MAAWTPEDYRPMRGVWIALFASAPFWVGVGFLVAWLT